MEKIHQDFMEEAKLKQLFHEYDTNSVEDFDCFLTKFLPKDKTYCQTKQNETCVYLAVSLQFLGFKKFYKHLFEKEALI